MSNPETKQALVPLAQRTVDFHGDLITGVLVQPGVAPAEWFVPLRPLCEYLGVAWPGQYVRTQEDRVFGPALISVTINLTEIPPPGPGGQRKGPGRGRGRRTLLCLPLEYLPGWLTGINAGHMRSEEMAEKITRYRREAFRVLWQAFAAQVLSQVVDDARLRALASEIAELNQTLTFLREHMADIAAAATVIATAAARLEEATALLTASQAQAAALATRADRTEARVERIDERTDHLAPAHKRQVQAFVDHMVQATRHLPEPLPYGRIYGRIKTRFQVGSYAEVPDDAFDALMAYLREMLRQATGEDAPRQESLF